MPIFKYFIFVGGALLALLFAADFVLPPAPVTQAIATGIDQPLIRIRSNRHLPERVVLDTSQPTIAAPAVQTAAVAAPEPPAQESLSPALAEMSAKTRVRETFAQFTPAPRTETAATRKTETRTEPRSQARQLQAAQAQTSPAQPKRKVARTPPPQPGRPMMLVAQQPHFGLFNNTW